MASLAANDVKAVAVDVGLASPLRVASTGVETHRVRAALPARSATLVRIAGLAVLCAATLVAPALLIVWMPIVLGVPHIASDIRFLVLPLPRRQVAISLGACAALVALKAVSLASGVALVQSEMVVVGLWLVGLIALDRPTQRSHALQRHARVKRRSKLVWPLVGFAAMTIVALPLPFAIVAAFAHNVVAVIAWVVVKRPGRRQALAVVGVLAAAIALLLLAGPAVASVTGGASSPWLTIDNAAHVMFGGVPLVAARALMIAFTFLQAVHYAVWLDWVPRGAPRMATKPWLLVVAGTLVVVTAGLVDPVWARTTYLALATFHIYLELVVLAARAARRLR